jgi:hypothetical protein
MLTKTQIKKLRKELPTGYAATIATKFNVSKALIYAIVAGSRNNSEILKALIELAQKNKADSKSNIETVNSL